MVSYSFIRNIMVERIGEINYDLDKIDEERDKLMKELEEAEEALTELEGNKGKYFDGLA